MKKLLLITVLVILGLSSCIIYQIYKATHPYSEKEKSEMKENASQAAIEYFKKEKNWDFTITKVEFSTDISRSRLEVSGYISGDKQKKVSASIDYSNDYTVGSISY
ncbi:hypothetical protein I6G76_14195 [Bacillus cereus]|uniref:Lipoprotein n=1 Tax=Bacillus cereus (strain ZK / E33L) TaxID=288681 RepID=Q63C16_BACCZ|nr:hypothetical protein [Bacillus cereus]AAU18297.1 hypothetical protein BCE33L1959 [Bacillus cereus E33L]AJI29465.1 hypothetical protein BF28_3519 [Bacillus cereus E33L]MCU4788224.1 hypothetical protein [Bacillus cereus]MCU5552919.1 hypothetical protein [Bacillus cereus]QQA24076.1 hypothetical protein I6G76_14195 [Bacillus cereus]